MHPGKTRVYPVIQRERLPSGRPAVVYRPSGTQTEVSEDGLSDAVATVEINVKSMDHWYLMLVTNDVLDALRADPRLLNLVGPSDAWDEDLQAYDRALTVDWAA